jgi:rod shape-determining protein MreC
MSLFSVFSSRHREKTTLVLAVALSLALLSLHDDHRLAVARSVTHALFLPVARGVQLVEDFVQVRGENRRLKKLVAALSLERDRLLQFRHERERLKKLAEFREDPLFDLVPCEVIGRGLDRFQAVLTVDKGRSDGLVDRMPVVSYNGLVGKVLQVFGASARVELLSSKGHAVSCLDTRSRVVGVLQWEKGRRFRLQDVNVAEDVAPGDTLVTSGYGGIYPKGLPVGRVLRVSPSFDRLFRSVEVESFVRFSTLEEVFVVRETVAWADSAVFTPDELELLGEARQLSNRRR